MRREVIGRFKLAAAAFASFLTCACASVDQSAALRNPGIETVLFPASGPPAVVVRLPEGFTVERQHGIDSQVARIRGPSHLINVEYGQVGGAQTCGSLPKCKQGVANLAGRRASWTIEEKQVQAAGGTYRQQMHLFVPLPGRPASTPYPPAGVLFNAACIDDCELAKQIALSTVFR